MDLDNSIKEKNLKMMPKENLMLSLLDNLWSILKNSLMEFANLSDFPIFSLKILSNLLIIGKEVLILMN